MKQLTLDDVKDLSLIDMKKSLKETEKIVIEKLRSNNLEFYLTININLLV